MQMFLHNLLPKANPEQEKLKKFEELSRESPHDAEFLSYMKATWLVSRANAYAKKKNFSFALKDISEAIELKPDHLPAFMTKAVISFKQKNLVEFKKTVTDMPNEMKVSERVLANKGDVMAQLKKDLKI